MLNKNLQISLRLLIMLCCHGLIITTMISRNALPNDDCVNAYHLKKVENWCSSPAQYTNNGADVSLDLKAECFTNGLDIYHDVWFKFTAVGNIANITVIGAVLNRPKGTLRKPQFALYAGACDDLKEVTCYSDSYGYHIAEAFAYDLVIGGTYYLRVDGRGINQGTFQLCINNYNEVPSPSSDCENAVILCDKSSFTVPSVIGSGKVKEDVSFTCLNDEESSAWYKFTCDKSGSLTFTLTPLNPVDDIDFALFFLPNGYEDCATKIPVRCMASGEGGIDWRNCSGKTGLQAGQVDTEEMPGCDFGDDNFVSSLQMLSGQSFALLIQNYHNTGNGFSIEFGGTGTFLGPKAWFKVSKLKLRIDTTLWTRDVSTFSGGIAKWEWNFGLDAKPQSSKKRGPHVIRYGSTGKKSIRLTVETKNGCIVSVVRTITVVNPPKPPPPPKSASPASTTPPKEAIIVNNKPDPPPKPPLRDSIPVVRQTSEKQADFPDTTNQTMTKIIRKHWDIERVGILYFVSDSFNIVPAEHNEVLREMVALLRANPNSEVDVEGHTNNIPHHSYCRELAEKRADSVVQYLMGKGIAEARIHGASIGKKQLKTENKSKQARKKNQRVEIKILYPAD